MRTCLILDFINPIYRLIGFKLIYRNFILDIQDICIVRQKNKVLIV